MYGHIIRATGVNDALITGMQMLKTFGVPVSSRGMSTIEVPGPVSTVYSNPLQRVLFDSVRDANPFFHLMESLWIIGGSDKVALPKYFMNSIDRFSDDGVRFHGAYGYRLRAAFGLDQLQDAIELLKHKNDSRQVVLSIWNPNADLGVLTKDVPCNDMIMLKIRHGHLNMTVCNRSNDAIWGAYGANVVQFSMLLEWLAASIGVKVGHYVQQSDSFHVYTDNPYWQYVNEPNNRVWSTPDNPYNRSSHPITPQALCSNANDAALFQRDCEELCERAEAGDDLVAPGVFDSTFFHWVVLPVIQGYDAYKRGDYASAVQYLMHCEASDWSLAMREWVHRRAARAAAKKEQA